MIAIDFGNLCFNSVASEENILVVAADKNMYLSIDNFIVAAFDFLESDERFCGNWAEIYKNRTNLPASADDIAWMESRLDEMNQRVSILYEPIIRAVYVVPPKWNDITLGIETTNEYILFLWGTSA